MPRTARIAPGGVVFHVLNRSNTRATIFDEDNDFMAFERIMAETVPLTRMRILAYLHSCIKHCNGRSHCAKNIERFVVLVLFARSILEFTTGAV